MSNIKQAAVLNKCAVTCSRRHLQTTQMITIEATSRH